MGTFWEDLGKKFGETAESVTNKAGEVMEIQKIKNQIRALERGNESDFADLGRMVYEEFKNGEEMSIEASGLCEAIQSREESIAEYEKQIAEVKGDFECANCGKTVLKGMAYCPYCGTKTPEEYAEKDDYVEKAYEYSEEMRKKAADAVEKAGDFAEKTVDKAGEWVEKAGDAVSDAVDKVEEKLEGDDK